MSTVFIPKRRIAFVVRVTMFSALVVDVVTSEASAAGTAAEATAAGTAAEATAAGTAADAATAAVKISSSVIF